MQDSQNASAAKVSAFYPTFNNRLEQTRTILNAAFDSILRERLSKVSDRSFWNKVYRTLMPDFSSSTLSVYAFYTDQVLKAKLAEQLDNQIILLQNILAGTEYADVVGVSLGVPVAKSSLNSSVYNLYSKYAKQARDYLTEEIADISSDISVSKIKQWNVLVTAHVLSLAKKTVRNYDRAEKKGDDSGLSYEIDNIISQETLLPATRQDLSFLI